MIINGARIIFISAINNKWGKRQTCIKLYELTYTEVATFALEGANPDLLDLLALVSKEKYYASTDYTHVCFATVDIGMSYLSTGRLYNNDMSRHKYDSTIRTLLGR